MAARGGDSTPRITRSTANLLHPFIFLAIISTAAIAAVETSNNNNNITAILSAYPQLSTFTSLLSSTAVAADLTSRTSLTIFAVPNPHLLPSTIAAAASTTPLADIVRYHIILRYLTWHDLHQVPPSGTLIPTLYQTTGRASENFGSLNLTYNATTNTVTLRPPTTTTSSPTPNFTTTTTSTPPESSSSSNSNSTSSSSTVLSLLKTLPYNLSIFTVDTLLTPYTSDLIASETRPPSPNLNITKTLMDGHGFNVAASMLSASGVIDEFEADEAGAGITLFVPTDSAFASLPPSVQLQALPADQKALVLKYHVLHSYYPLGSLESIVNPLQPTLATEDSGAGSFTLNISRVNGSVALNSGVVEGIVTQTVFDQNPVAIFGISRVLLPKEMFGAGKEERSVNLGARNGSASSSVGGGVFAPPPIAADSPAPAGVSSPSSTLLSSSPPGLRDEVQSSGGGRIRITSFVGGVLLLLNYYYYYYFLLSVGL